MRLVTYETGGQQKPGVILADGSVLDLTEHWRQQGTGAAPANVLGLLRGGPSMLSAAAELLASAEEQVRNGAPGLTTIPASSALWCPPLSPGRIYAIGLNYRSHAEEQGAKIPRSPVVFTKASSSLTGHGRPIIKPRETEALDYEAELAVVIGRPGSGIAPADARDYIAGYTCLNDVTARDLQRADRQWFRSKSYPSFCPLGRELVTVDEAPPLDQIVVSCAVGTQQRQCAPVTDLIFGVPELISFLSSFVTLEVGDVIATGTPGGVGFVLDPPKFLQPGDEVTVDIKGVSSLANHVQGPATAER
jgi:2-keto-4-pentenoate hydratase/2-oxohepta-3-ene-1,7-dioic acid hydratase in catechol pathway